MNDDALARALEARPAPRPSAERLLDVAAEGAWRGPWDGEEQRLVARPRRCAGIGRIDQVAELQDELGVGPAYDRPGQRLAHAGRVLRPALGRGRLGDAAEGGAEFGALSRL